MNLYKNRNNEKEANIFSEIFNFTDFVKPVENLVHFLLEKLKN